MNTFDHFTEWESRLILGLRPANERRRYFVTTSLIGWVRRLFQDQTNTDMQFWINFIYILEFESK